MTRRRRLSMALAALAATPNVALAQVSGTWTSLFGTLWSSGWTCWPLFPNGGGTAVFPSNYLNSRDISLSAFTTTLSNLIFDSTARFSVSTGYLNIADQLTVNVVQPSHSSPNTFMGHLISARLLGTGALVKEGPGVLTLAAGNTYSGGTTVNNGTLIYTDNSSFGTGSVVMNGGGLRPMSSGSFPLTVPIHVGVGGGTLMSVGTDLPALRAVDSIISGSGTLSLEGIEIDALSYGFTLSADSPFGGTARVATPVLLTGSLNSASGLALSDVLWLDNSVANLQRISDNARIELLGGSIHAKLPQGGLAAVEQVGDVLVKGGMNVLGDDKIKFVVGNLERGPQGILAISPLGLQITGTRPALSGNGTTNTTDVGIVPWVHTRGNAISPVTVDSNGFMRPLNGSEFITTIPVGVTTANLKLTTNSTIANPITVNSFTFTPSPGNGSVLGPGTITVTSGAVFVSHVSSSPFGANSGIFAPLEFGSAAGVIHTPSNAEPGGVNWVAVSSAISGSGGLTIPGYSYLGGTSTYTGQTIVHGGVKLDHDVIPGQAGPLGMDTSPVLVESGSIWRDLGPGTPYESSGQVVFAPIWGPVRFERDLLIKNYGSIPSFLGLGVPGLLSPSFSPATVGGDIYLEGNLNVFGRYDNDHLIISGDISGPGRITETGSVTFSGNNTYTGGIQIGTSAIAAGSNTAFGAGTLWITGNGTISSTASFTLNNPVVVQANARIGGSQPIGFSGAVDLFGGTRMIELVNSAITTFSGPIFDGSLVKTGSGTMQIARVNVSTLTVSSGDVRTLPDNPASVVRSLSIAPEASLDLTNNAYIIYSSAPIKQYLSDSRLYSSLATPNVTTIGYGPNSVLGYTTFGGQQIGAAPATLVKYTFFGDANLDGVVNVLDLVMLANGWLAAGNWTSGDFDRSGFVDAHDLGLLALNWQPGNDQPLGVVLEELGLPAPVPEPTFAPLAASSLLLRRRRKK